MSDPRPSERLRALWSVPTEYTIEDELNAARESAMMHAQALDEVRRDLAKERRSLALEKRKNQQLILEVLHLRRTNKSLQHTLDEIQKLVNE